MPIVSDSELIDLARNGNADAYSKLWCRYRVPALAIARRLSRTEAEDVVSEAFTEIWAQLQRDRGPREYFLAYVLRVVRNIAARSYHARRQLLTAVEFEGGVTPGADASAEKNQSRQATYNAFASLPERWQQVLWWLEVEQLSRSEVALRLDISPNSVSALSRRAKEGLRLAWLETRLPVLVDVAHARQVSLLPKYIRGSLSKVQHTAVRDHILHCASCQKTENELKNANRKLGGRGRTTVLLGIILGGVASLHQDALELLTGVSAIPAATSASVSPAFTDIQLDLAVFGPVDRVQQPGGMLVSPAVGGVTKVGSTTLALVVAASLSAVTVYAYTHTSSIQNNQVADVADASEPVRIFDGTIQDDRGSSTLLDRGIDHNQADDDVAQTNHFETHGFEFNTAGQPSPGIFEDLPVVASVPSVEMRGFVSADADADADVDSDSDSATYLTLNPLEEFPGEEPVENGVLAISGLTVSSLQTTETLIAPLLNGTAIPQTVLTLEGGGLLLEIPVGNNGDWSVDLSLAELPKGLHNIEIIQLVEGDRLESVQVSFELMVPAITAFSFNDEAQSAVLTWTRLKLVGAPGAQICGFLSDGNQPLFQVILDANGDGVHGMLATPETRTQLNFRYCDGPRLGATVHL